MTAFLALRWLGEMKSGERVLLHAGASGVSTAGIQLAALRDCHVIVTAGSDEKIEFCKYAHFTHSYHTQRAHSDRHKK